MFISLKKAITLKHLEGNGLTQNVISNCSFNNISSTTGAIYLYYASDLEISKSVFSRNTATIGAAIYLFFESIDKKIKNLFLYDST